MCYNICTQLLIFHHVAGDLNSCWCYTWWWFLLTMMTRPEQLYLDSTCWLSTSSRVVAVSVCWCGITQVLRLTPPSSSSGLYPRLNIEPPPSSTAESGDPNSSLLLLLRSNQQQSIFHTRPKLTLKNPKKTRPWKVSSNPLAGPSGGLSCPIIFSYFRTRWDPAFPQCMFNLFFFLMVWPSFGRIYIHTILLTDCRSQCCGAGAVTLDRLWLKVNFCFAFCIVWQFKFEKVSQHRTHNLIESYPSDTRFNTLRNLRVAYHMLSGPTSVYHAKYMIRVCLNFCPLCALNPAPPPPLIPTVHDLKAEGALYPKVFMVSNLK